MLKLSIFFSSLAIVFAVSTGAPNLRSKHNELKPQPAQDFFGKECSANDDCGTSVLECAKIQCSPNEPGCPLDKLTCQFKPGSKEKPYYEKRCRDNSQCGSNVFLCVREECKHSLARRCSESKCRFSTGAPKVDYTGKPCYNTLACGGGRYDCRSNKCLLIK